MKSTNSCQVKDNNSNEILFETDLNHVEDAYKYAASCEQMGLDVKVITPDLADILNSHFSSDEDSQKLRQELNDEISDHEDSCCFKKQ